MTTANIQASPARTSVGRVYFWGIFLFCAFTLMVVVWFNFLGSQQSYDDQRAAARATKLQALRTEDQKSLSGYSWVNKEKGLARIPIERAMEMVASESKNASVAPSTVKVENPYPAGLAPVPAAAPAAAPAPEATK
jgi:hypothetical protein